MTPAAITKYRKPRPAVRRVRPRAPLPVKAAPKPTPAPRPRPTPAPKPPRPKPVDPVVAEVDARFKPAYTALEQERLKAAADRDRRLKDREAFDAWAAGERERRLALVTGDFAKSNAAAEAARKESTARIAGAIESAMSRVGGLGTTALGATGYADQLTGTTIDASRTDVASRRANEVQAAIQERATRQGDVDRRYGDSLAAQAAAAYGRRTSELDAQGLALDRSKSDAVQKTRDAQAKAAEEQWMRDYLAGKQSDTVALGKAKLEVQQRGQDMTFKTAAANREAANARAAAALAPSSTGYKGRTAAQYNSLKDGWVRRTASDLNEKKFDGNAILARDASLRQLDLMVEAGLRPMDAVRAVEAGNGGDLVSVEEYRAFLAKHLPTKNINAALRQLFGYETPGATIGGGDQGSAARRAQKAEAARRKKAREQRRRYQPWKP